MSVNSKYCILVNYIRITNAFDNKLMANMRTIKTLLLLPKTQFWLIICTIQKNLAFYRERRIIKHKVVSFC